MESAIIPTMTTTRKRLETRSRRGLVPRSPSQQTQAETAGAQGTISKQPGATANVGVTTGTTPTQNSTVLPRLQGEIDRRVTTLTKNDRAIHKLAKMCISVVHAGRRYTVQIGIENATKLVANASGLGQMQASESARNAMTTVP